jgi:hypothetical protein
MFLCRVLVGEYCLGREDQHTPDVRRGTELYDSTVNDLEAPRSLSRTMIRKRTRNTSSRSRRNEHEAGSIRHQHLWPSTSHSETWRKG